MVCLFLGFKLKDFLHENETLSTFLQQNASFSHNYVQNILEADVNLEKVSIENIILRHKSCPRLFKFSIDPLLPCPNTQTSHLLYCDFTAYSLEGIVIVFRYVLIVYCTHAAKLPLESVKERKPACILIVVCKSTDVSHVTCPRGITQSTVLINDHRQPSFTLMYPLNVHSRHLV